MEEKKQEWKRKAAQNEANGIKCDVEFQMMVERARQKVVDMKSHKTPADDKINICVRKRPAFEKELE